MKHRNGLKRTPTRSPRVKSLKMRKGHGQFIEIIFDNSHKYRFCPVLLDFREAGGRRRVAYAKCKRKAEGTCVNVIRSPLSVGKDEVGGRKKRRTGQTGKKERGSKLAERGWGRKVKAESSQGKAKSKA